MDPKESSKEPSNCHERENGWSEVIRGERYIIRTSSAETNGVYSMLEVIADPRNGVPMHVHDNADEHFIILEGKAFIANGDRRVEVAAVRPLRSPEAYLMLGAILPKTLPSACW
jgi:mannose-6-phosphate isomerase-like protein (cupin superfamily)